MPGQCFAPRNVLHTCSVSKSKPGLSSQTVNWVGRLTQVSVHRSPHNWPPHGRPSRQQRTLTRGTNLPANASRAPTLDSRSIKPHHRAEVLGAKIEVGDLVRGLGQVGKLPDKVLADLRRRRDPLARKTSPLSVPPPRKTYLTYCSGTILCSSLGARRRHEGEDRFQLALRGKVCSYPVEHRCSAPRFYSRSDLHA